MHIASTEADMISKTTLIKFQGRRLGSSGLSENRIVAFWPSEKGQGNFDRSGGKIRSILYQVQLPLAQQSIPPGPEPNNTYRAHREMKRLNHLSDTSSRLIDSEIIDVIQSDMLSVTNDKFRFFVVEDESDLLELYHDVLETEGCRIMAATNGEERLAVFRLFHPETVWFPNSI